MAGNVLDLMIGAAEVQRDVALAASELAKADKAEASGDHFAALAHLKRAAAADPSDTRIQFKLGYALDLSGDEESAIDAYERAIEKPPAPINALINLAILYEDRGEWHRAERCLRQVLETNPNHGRAKLYMQDVLASKGMILDEDHNTERFKRSALLDTPVTDFELTVRTRTALKKMNIRTLGDLVRTTEAELTSYKNFGDQSLSEIKTMLTAKGLRLGQGRDDAHRAARRAMLEQYRGTGQEAILSKPVGDLNLSVRARKALQLLNIVSLGDLVTHTEAELLGVKNFGATSLTEVKAKLAEFGLGLREIEAEG